MTSNSAGATNDLLHAVAEDVTAALRHELRRAQEEFTEKARQAARGGTLLGGAAVLGVLATGTSAVFVVRFLDRWLPPRSAAFVATALYAGGAVALGVAGWDEVRRSVPTMPTDMVSHVRDELVDALTETPRQSPPAGPVASTED
jgi:protein-S-isoprenylcysteine O-methyltransferase Ste14